jgi:hypothetical protein
MLPEVAVIVVAPIPTGVAFPWEPDALLIVATDEADELHSTAVVISCVLPSEKVSVALNCRDVPTAMPSFAGVMAMDTGVTGLTVRVEETDILPEAAVMVVAPIATEEALPLEPAVLLIVATDVADELQVTDAVRSCVLLSEKIPVAVNCSDVPMAIPGLVGVTEMDASVAAVTVRFVKPEIVPKVAVMVVTPAAAEEAFPLEPAVLLIAAIDAADEYHVTDDVRF